MPLKTTFAWKDQIHSKKNKIRRALLHWFRNNARDLPWRRSRDPYQIWLSEIMLQQTQVATVLPYFERFIKAYPTVELLAKAKEDQVLKLWEGLGYYTRARNLQKAAKVIVQEFNGIFPDSPVLLQQLPGIGRYTAGAIASIAFGKKTPVLDGNIKRVLTRIFSIPESIDNTSTHHALWATAGQLVSPSAPGDFNQALMELGARICTPKRPRCHLCPVNNTCNAFQLGQQDEFPVRRPRKPVPHREIVAAAIRKNGRYLLGKRPPDSMLGGLWEFPGGKVEEGETHENALVRELKEEIGIGIKVSSPITTVKHAYSHFSITLHVYLCEHTTGKPQTIYHTDLKWVFPGHFSRYPMPTADLKFLHLL